MPLKIELSCEIDNLIDEVSRISHKGCGEVEKAMFKTHIYPEGTKVYLTTQFGSILDNNENVENFKWLEDALQSIFKESNITSIYVTTAI